MGNTGLDFEKDIYEKVKEKCKQNNSLICRLHKRYYSLERQDYIIPDITIEKYIDGQLFFLIVIECKDYIGNISVSEIEEFHSKLQQIGADNTKGIMVTRNGKYQRSALNYAKSKGISLAICQNSIFLTSAVGGGMFSNIMLPLYVCRDIICCAKYDFDKIIDYCLNRYDQ